MNKLPITDLTIASLSEKTVAIEYDAQNNPIYVGEAEPGSAKSEAKWRIKRIIWDFNGNATDIQWAEGSQRFEFIWNNRASYNYK